MSTHCTHIKLGGDRCTSPTLAGKTTCQLHTPAKADTQTPNGSSFPSIMPLENAASIQGALMQVIDLLLKDRIDAQKGRIILRCIELASRNLKNLQPAPAKPTVEQHDPEAASSADPATGPAKDQSTATAKSQTTEKLADPSSHTSAIRQAIHAAAADTPGKAAAEPILCAEVNPKGEAVLVERVETSSEGVQK